MNTCNTCRYWSVKRNIVKNVSDCDRPDCKEDEHMTFEIDVQVDDDSNLRVTILTSGNFGCTLHQHKKK